MRNEQTETLILRDKHREYYVLSREVLDQTRVPVARRGEVERLVAAATPAGGDTDTHDDVAGFAATFPGAPPTLGGQAQLLGFSFGLTAQALFGPSFPTFTPPPDEQVPLT